MAPTRSLSCCKSRSTTLALGTPLLPIYSRPGEDDAEQEVASKCCAATVTVEFVIKGVDCLGCASTIENLLQPISGIYSCKVNPATSEIKIHYNPRLINHDAIENKLSDAGYQPSLKADDTPESLLAALERTTDTAELFCSMRHCATFEVLLWLSTSLQILHTPLVSGVYLHDMLAMCFATAILYRSKLFYLSSYRALKSRRPNVDLLITVGATASFVYSLLAILSAAFSRTAQQPVAFFDTTGELFTLAFVGRWMECKAMGRMSQAMVALVSLLPAEATRLVGNCEVTTRIVELSINDEIVVHPGESFAADCVVLSGTSEVDESAWTGDIQPVKKIVEDRVHAGTINLSSTLICRVQKLGLQTRLSEVIDLIKNAQTSRSRIQVLADRVGRVFIPAVLLLSGMTFVFWYNMGPERLIGGGKDETAHDTRIMVSLQLAISVLVVACPCALSIATPAAVMCGTGVGAQYGILIRGADIIEKVSRATDFVFDKTRTVTTGVMNVVQVSLDEALPRSGITENELWSLVIAAELAAGTSHPVSKALCAYASTRCRLAKASAELENVLYVPGRGLRATIVAGSGRSRVLHLGNVQHLLAAGVPPESFQSPDQNPTLSRVCIALDQTLLCHIWCADVIKSDASNTIEELKNMGKTIWMLTGDHPGTAQEVASQVGILPSHVISECTIEDKVAAIKKLQQLGKVVAMIGDGLNDSPALATADVGISFDSATWAAMSTADIVLMKPDALADVVNATVLCQNVYQRIQYNLYFAFLWNVLGIPFAMGILLPYGLFLPPTIAGCLMPLSCLGIIGNSLLLTTWLPRFS